MSSRRSRQLVADVFGKMERHVTPPFRRAVNVIEVGDDLALDTATQIASGRQLGKREPHRARRSGRDGQYEFTGWRIEGADQQHAGASVARERDLPERSAADQRRRWNLDPPQQFARFKRIAL